MKKIFYYTVYFQTYDGVEQNGIKDLYVYCIENNNPELLCVVSTNVDEELYEDDMIEELVKDGYVDEENEDLEISFVEL